MSDDKRPVIYHGNLNFFRNLILQVRLVWLLMLDSRVPLWTKAMPLGALAYVLLPTDFLPDFAPLLGQIDDIAALVIGLGTFISLCPPDVVEEHMESLKGSGAGWKMQTQGNAKAETKPEPETAEGTVIDGTFTEPPPGEQ
jgi:uncharacterized membrane protein YkvA (DUF1232 family)